MTNNKQSNPYFTAQEADLFTFYRIPKGLITNPKYKSVCAEAKLLYGLQLDRNSLSLRNGWIDERGYIYIIFTREEAMEVLGIGKEKACELFKQLREVDLIEEVRQGQGKANIIYVKRFTQTPPSVDIPQKSEKPTSESRNFVTTPLKSEFPTSKSSENRPQEVGKTDRSNTDITKTYLNEKKISQSVWLVTGEDTNEFCQTKTDGQTDSASPQTEMGNKELEHIYQNAQTALYTARFFIENVIKKLYTDRQMPYILKMGLTHAEIQARLRLLTHAHLDAALAKLPRVKANKELYFTKCLLTAIVEVDLDGLLQEEGSIPELSRPQNSPQRDNFEQRAYTDEELERFYDKLN